MSKMKNWMMDIQEFCDGYFYDSDSECTVEQVVEGAGIYFQSNVAKNYARQYITEQLGEM
jgi:hypothetical protein